MYPEPSHEGYCLPFIFRIIMPKRESNHVIVAVRINIRITREVALLISQIDILENDITGSC